jgi:hypothetical protein
VTVTTIRDQKFLTWFYLHCCHRGVHGRFNQQAIASKRIEVCWTEGFGQQLEIGICDIPGESTIDLGWSPTRGAWPVYCTAADSYLRECDRVALTVKVRQLLLKHGFIEKDGMLVRRGVA